jgi:hypothetical protein
MYVLRNIEARSCNRCCSGKAVSITYSECVFVALGVQHAVRMRHVIFCSLCDCTVSFHVSHSRHDVRKKMNIKV